MAQSVECPTSAQWWSHGWWVWAPRQALRWQLRAWSCFGFYVSLSLCPSPTRALSLSKINIKNFLTKYRPVRGNGVGNTHPTSSTHCALSHYHKYLKTPECTCVPSTQKARKHLPLCGLVKAYHYQRPVWPVFPLQCLLGDSSAALINSLLFT